MSGISLGRVTAILLAGRTLGYALSLLNSVVLARVLGVERLGAYAYAMGVAALFGLLPNLGISTIVTRSVAREPNTAGRVVRTAVRAQLLLAGGVLVLIPAFAAVLPGQPVPLWYVGLAAAQLAVGTLSWPYLAVVGGRARYDRLAAAELASGCAGTVATLATAAARGGVAAFLFAHVLAAGFSVLVARRISLPLFPPEDPGRLGLRALVREAAPLGATAALQSLYARLDIVMLGQLASRTALGLYSAAYKPINMAVYLGTTISGPLLPLMAQGPPQGAPMAFQRALRWLGVTAPAFGLAMSGLAAPLLGLLFGAEYLPAAPILSILAWSAAANWLYTPLGISLQARGHERLWLFGVTFGLFMNAGGNLWAIPRWAGIGAAGATLASEMALLALGTISIRRRLSIGLSSRPLVPLVFATAAGGGVLVATQGLGPLPATAAALAVYGALAFALRIVSGEDVMLALEWVRQAAVGWSRG